VPFLRSHPISIFIALNVLASVVLCTTDPHGDAVAPQSLRWLTAVSPALSAVLLTWASNGWKGVCELLSRLFVWRTDVRWYVVVLLVFPSLSLLAILLWHAIEGEFPAFVAPSHSWNPKLFDPFVIGLMTVQVMVTEEVGWRGYLQVQLQRRWRALESAVLVGVVWTVWHGEYFRGGLGESWSGVLFLLEGIALSVLLAWVYHNARRSLLLVGFGHAAANLGLFLPNLLVTPPEECRAIRAIFVALLVVVCVVVVRSSGRDLLAGGRSNRPASSRDA